MNSLSLATLAAMAGGTLIQGAPETMVHGVATDSRALPPGSLFVALVGESFDAHDFLGAVVEGGAVGVMVAEARRGRALALNSSVGVITVPDTLLGLQTLAVSYRDLIDPRVVAITGSNGKTTAKEFTRAVLSTRFATHATAGNFNNHIGLPLTMLAHSPEQSHGVYELGMNHPGEIVALGRMAKPDIAVITTMGSAHIEFFGSREAIAEEKISLFPCLSAAGVAVVNLESPFAELAVARAPGKVVTTGIGRGDVRASDLQVLPDGGTRFRVETGMESCEVRLGVPGVHMVQNALLALAVGWVEGIPLDAGAAALAGGLGVGGRLQVRGWRGATLIDDTYNANPDSMKAALDTLAAQPCSARRIAILGGMGELGAHSDDGHADVGRHAAGLGLDVIATVGPAAGRIAAAAGRGALVFPDHASCARWLSDTLGAGDVVLVKGSRSAAMEKVLPALEGESA